MIVADIRQGGAAREADAVIVGAGLAGLSAARELEAAGRTAIVLEARDRAGGRTLSRELASETIDLGAQWLGPGQDRMYKLAEELGVRTFRQFNKGRKVLARGEKISTYGQTIPSLPILSLIDLQLAINKAERLAKTAPLAPPFDAQARAWDAMTVETWKARHVRTAGARMVFDVAVRSIFAAEPRDLSFLFFLHYLRQGRGFMNLAEINNGAQQDRAHGGMQQISTRLAERLRSPVILNAPVRAIEQGEGGVVVRSDAGEFRARRAIVALAPLLAGRIAYSPALPAARDQVMQRMPMGSVIKCVAAYKRPFWREAGFSGEMVHDAGPLRLSFDDSPEDASSGALVGFILGDAAREQSGRGAEARRAAVLAAYQKYFGPEAASPTDYVDQDWPSEEWSRGCYVGYMPPGVMTDCAAALRAPCGRIHWAGTETAREWMGYMEGAVESGARAAAEAAAAGSS